MCMCVGYGKPFCFTSICPCIIYRANALTYKNGFVTSVFLSFVVFSVSSVELFFPGVVLSVHVTPVYTASAATIIQAQ